MKRIIKPNTISIPVVEYQDTEPYSVVLAHHEKSIYVLQFETNTPIDKVGGKWRFRDTRGTVWNEGFDTRAYAINNMLITSGARVFEFRTWNAAIPYLRGVIEFPN